MNGRKKPCPLQTVNDTKRICEQGTETDDIKCYSTTNNRNKIQKERDSNWREFFAIAKKHHNN